MVRTEGSKPVTPPPAAPTMEVLSPLPSSFPAPVEITHATNATISVIPPWVAIMLGSESLISLL